MFNINQSTKKWTIFALLTLMAAMLVLSACGGEDATATPVPEPTEPAAQPTEAPKATEPPEPTEAPKPTEPPAAAEPTILRVANTGEDIQFLDAQKVQSGMDLPHSDLLYSRLTMYDPTMMDPVPDVAESWTVTEDDDGGMTIVFKLREDVKFHTGRGLTAEDVVYSWDRAINEIADKGRGAGELADVVSYEATGPYELTVKVNKVSPVFLPSMGHWALAIVDKETIETIDTEPVGTGPYKFVEHIPADRLVLEKFDDYHDQAALANWPDRIVIMPFSEEQTRIAALQAGEVDIAVTVAYQFLEDIEGTEGLHLVEQPGGLSASYLTLAFNLREGPTADPLVREAIQYAIDKEAIHNAVFFGLGDVDCNFIPKNHWAYEPIECPERDVEKAKELLAEAGFPDGLTLGYIPEANELTQKMAEVIKQSLAEAGIEIEITIVDSARWLDEVWFGHQFDITDAWYTRESDPDGLMQSVFRKELGNNVMGYYEQEIEDLFDAGKSTLDQEERKAIYQQIVEKVALEDIPLIKIQAMPRFAAANEHVEDAHVSPKGYFHFKDYIFVP